MCGIVCYFGRSQGVTHVLEALRLLEYRAPDSTGVVTITENGRFSIRKSVGTARQLIENMARDPLYPSDRAILEIGDLFAKQSLKLSIDSLRDCSMGGGHTLEDMYKPDGLNIGVGDRGAPDFGLLTGHQNRFSSRMTHTLEDTGVSSSPDYDQDPVRHAFRLIGAHVASRVGLDPGLSGTLNRVFLERVPQGNYENWEQAWAEEVALNIPGQAFAVAVRHFQKTFPGLAACLGDTDWEHVGGVTASAMSQIVMGHGRWAMVGAVTKANAHPFVDRSQTRAACENGSHNASLLLKVRDEQEGWWRARGLPENEPVHRSENTTEVIVYEWERNVHRIHEGDVEQDSLQFIHQLEGWGIEDSEEQALRLTLWSLRPGNAHACTFQSRQRPGVLYISSHNKPIAIISRTETCGESGDEHREIMVASDLNAGLMLWPGDQVDAAVDRMDVLQREIHENTVDKETAKREIQSILDKFSVEVLFMDQELYSGEELFARIENQVEDGKIVPKIQITLYDGTPVACVPQRIKINPAMVGKRGYPSYTELHIAEIPDVLDRIVAEYVRDGEIRIESSWLDENIFSPGLNLDNLKERFGARLERLKRLMLIGEGSSWRDAQAAAPLFRALLPDVLTVVNRPVEVLNLGKTINPQTDLVIEISWSGTTDSLLKMDSWLAQGEVLRLGVTGRPQSDLGRRTAHSGGTLDVQSGVEVSVATVKGFEAILMTLYLSALKLAELHHQTPPRGELTRLQDELSLAIPKHVRDVIQDENCRKRIRQVARRCHLYNKVAVVGNSPIEIEAELKIEELAQIVACPFDFHIPSLRSLIERSAIVRDDRQRTLFIINATSDEAQKDARSVVNYLNSLGVFCIVHTTLSEQSEAWQALPHVEVFYSPQVSDNLQSLIDAPFFFEFAVALTYARDLSPEEVDRPRNLAKSVTTTSAEKRSEVEARRDFVNITLNEFSRDQSLQPAWDEKEKRPTREALQASTSLRTALAVLTESLPDRLALESDKSLILVTDTEATENAGKMARGAWAELLSLDITVFRRFLDEVPGTREGTKLIRLLRAGAILTVQDSETITLPADISPLQLELLGTVYLIGLAVRLARQRGIDTDAWEAGMARLPFIVAAVLENQEYAHGVRVILDPFVARGYDKVQIIGGGQDYTAGASIARSLRSRGFMAEALYTDSAWHGPLAAVGGPDADHDTLTVVLATDPLFQPAAMVDTQVYRTRNAPVILVVPEGNQDLLAVRGVDASAILTIPALPRPFLPVANAALGAVLAREMNHLWSKRIE